MVRLIVYPTTQEKQALIGFNSKMVRLIAEYGFVIEVKDDSFNSKMVRLIENQSCSGFVIELWFQFQNGAIDRYTDAISVLGQIMFQFQNGAIDSSQQ